MILDQNTLLSSAQAITADAVSTNTLDLGKASVIPYGNVQIKRQLGGAGCKIPLLIQVVEDFAACTSLIVSVESDDSDAFASPKVLLSQEVALADLKAGFIFQGLDKLPEVKERYVRLKYDVTGVDATAGKITAGIVGAVDQVKS